MYIKKFRNIEEANLTFGKKINIISGQNGAGKSNILSLIASASGMPKNAFEVIKNSGINIQPDFYDYFHINSNEDFLNYEVFSTYRSTATDKTITKLLRFKDDTDQGRGIRLIPTVSQIGASNEFAFTSKVAAIKYAKNNFNITYEARIPLATQYLSISRLVPRGESDLKKALITKRSSIKKLESNNYKSWYNEVLNHSIISTDPEMTNIGKKITNKKSVTSIDEPIPHTTPDSISVGQDSLTHIITALIGFDLIHDNKNYNGGILCIDEFDISLHPAAQVELLNLLDRLCSNLNIQIFLTTHSLTAIKELSNLIKKNGAEDYRIIYLKDREHPIVTQHNDYYSVKADMYLESKINKPKVKVYFEDEMTQKMFHATLNSAYNLKLISPTDYPEGGGFVQEISGHLGKSNLRWLNEKDDNFQNSILVLDGDALYADNISYNKNEYIRGDKDLPSPGNRNDYANIVRLTVPFAPESFIYYLLNYYVNADNDETRHFWREADRLTTIGRQTIKRDYLFDDNVDINNDFLKDDKNKEIVKKMLDLITQTNMLHFWFKYNDTRLSELERFSKELKTAYKKTNTHLASRLI